MAKKTNKTEPKPKKERKPPHRMDAEFVDSVFGIVERLFSDRLRLAELSDQYSSFLLSPKLAGTNLESHTIKDCSDDSTAERRYALALAVLSESRNLNNSVYYAREFVKQSPHTGLLIEQLIARINDADRCVKHAWELVADEIDRAKLSLTPAHVSRKSSFPL